MLPSLPLLLPFLFAGAIAVPAAAAVSVSFTNPERYTDVGRYYGQSETTQRELEQYLQQLGERYLAPGQTLAVEVLDIDLAGRYEPWGRDFHEVRILSGRADFPLMKLRYVLKAEGRVLASGEESIADLGYMFRATRYSSNNSLHYEKRMLRDWFKERFVGHRPAQGPRRD